jgi:thiol-disulfide isomerase/thioredoxin
MSTAKVVLVTVLAGIIGVGFAIFGKQWLGDDKPLHLPIRLGTPDDDRLDSLPELRLPDLTGRELSSQTWAGKTLVLNFWATWCPPCLREMPLLSEAQEQYADSSLQVVGIAIDKPEDVAAFVAANPVSYPVLIGDAETIELSRRLGNRLQGLPFTVIFDHDGKRVHHQIGELTRASLGKHLAALMGDAQTAGN